MPNLPWFRDFGKNTDFTKPGSELDPEALPDKF